MANKKVKILNSELKQNKVKVTKKKSDNLPKKKKKN